MTSSSLLPFGRNSRLSLRSTRRQPPDHLGEPERRDLEKRISRLSALNRSAMHTAWWSAAIWSAPICRRCCEAFLEDLRRLARRGMGHSWQRRTNVWRRV